MDYLGAINNLLREVGTRAVTSVNIAHPDVVDAKTMLEEWTDKLLKRGWWFNRMKNVLKTPDENGYISLNSTVLRFEITHEVDKRDYPLLTKRQNRLLDLNKNTYQFGRQLTLDLFIELEWDDLPDAAQQYIVSRAASAFVRVKLEDTPKSRDLLLEAQEHMNDLHAQELQTEKNNMFDSPAAASMRMRRRPFRRHY